MTKKARRLLTGLGYVNPRRFPNGLDVTCSKHRKLGKLIWKNGYPYVYHYDHRLYELQKSYQLNPSGIQMCYYNPQELSNLDGRYKIRSEIRSKRKEWTDKTKGAIFK